MDLRIITDKQKNEYNRAITHIVQSWEWGEFKSKFSQVVRYGIFKNGKLKTAFTLTLHKIPLTSQYVGYLPKGPLPDKELAQALETIGHSHRCAFIKIEPNIEVEQASRYSVDPLFAPSLKSLYTQFNFIVDLTCSEDQLLQNMHPKTRYNIKLAQKKGVQVEIRTDDKAFEIFLKLHFETTQRQNFFSHNSDYHHQVWQMLKEAGMARVIIGFYTPPGSKTKKPLSAWMLYNFKDTLYYPYGGSSNEYREVMANNLVAWEAIREGKRLGLKKFDMWGALGPDADPNDPWQGFTRFKEGYGGKRVEYLGTYDLIFNDPLYWMFSIIDHLTPVKVFLLKLLRK